MEAAKVILLDFVLCLRRLDRLPLHITRRIRAAALERHYVVDHISGTRARGFAGGWARVRILEIVLGGRAPLDTTPRVAGA